MRIFFITKLSPIAYRQNFRNQIYVWDLLFHNIWTMFSTTIKNLFFSLRIRKTLKLSYISDISKRQKIYMFCRKNTFEIFVKKKIGFAERCRYKKYCTKVFENILDNAFIFLFSIINCPSSRNYIIFRQFCKRTQQTGTISGNIFSSSKFYFKPSKIFKNITKNLTMLNKASLKLSLKLIFLQK